MLNKVDAVRKKERLLKVSHALHAQFDFDWPAFMVSARTGDGIDHLRGWLLLSSRPREWIAPAGVTHLQAPLARATEIIRELIFTYLRGELPYTIEQRNLAWTELSHPEGGLRIDQQLVVPKHRRSALKLVERRMPGIASAARTRLREEFQRVVFVHLSATTASELEVERLSVSHAVQVEMPLALHAERTGKGHRDGRPTGGADDQ